jgi:cytosine deaminase
MPCYLCAGAVVQFGIPRVVAGENKNFAGAAEWLQGLGVETIVLNDADCAKMMSDFIDRHSSVWNEDIGHC